MKGLGLRAREESDSIQEQLKYGWFTSKHDMEESYKELPQTPLVPGGVTQSVFFSRKAAFSLTDPAQTACFPKFDGFSFSSTAPAPSPFPMANSGDGAVAAGDVKTEVKGEVLGLLVCWTPRLLQGGWPEEK